MQPLNFLNTQKTGNQEKNNTIIETDPKMWSVQCPTYLWLLHQEVELVFSVLEFGLNLTLTVMKIMWEVTLCITHVLLECGHESKPELASWRGHGELRCPGQEPVPSSGHVGEAVFDHASLISHQRTAAA